MASAVGVVVLSAGYAVTLAMGYLSLGAADQPIGDPWFSLLELLIVVVMPGMITLMVAVHAWAPAPAKVLSMTALIFMIMVATLTISLHAVILVLGASPSFADQPWRAILLSFQWPSLPYALDMVAWDLFFALSMLFAAPVFGGGRLAVTIRVLMVASGLLALAGLSGPISGNMSLRNIGVVGYVGVFPIIAALLGVLFYREPPFGAERSRSPGEA